MTDEATPAGDPAGVASRRAGSATAAPERRRRRGFRRLAVEIGVALVLVMLVRALLAQSYFVPSASMEPTVMTGDRVVVVKTTTVQRGDLVVFDGTDTFAAADRSPYMSDGIIGSILGGVADLLGVNLGEQDFLKRVAATGGQQISCTPDGGLVVDGESVAEPYLAEGVAACEVPFDVTVPEGHYFMLGDNRPESADSRAHLGSPGGGMVPEDDVVGTVELRYWPLGDVGPVD